MTKSWQEKLHILLIGPPAVGKLTIANSLSLCTGFPVFDNSKTVEFSKLIYEFRSPDYARFRDKLRFTFYNEAIKSDIGGLISTFCHAQPVNSIYLKKVIDIFDKNGWETSVNLLIAEIETLKSRVERSERKSKFTIQKEEELVKWLSANNQYRQVKLDKYRIQDNTHMTIKESTNDILEYLENEYGQ